MLLKVTIALTRDPGAGTDGFVHIQPASGNITGVFDLQGPLTPLPALSNTN